MKDLFDRYDAVIVFAYMIWAVACGLIGQFISYELGVYLMFGPLILFFVGLSVYLVGQRAWQQIRESHAYRRSSKETHRDARD
jgi:hypothetical protein